MSYCRVVSLTLMTCTICMVTAEQLVNEEKTTSILNVVSRLSKLVEHYNRIEEVVNVDGLYGLRIAQGAISASLKHTANRNASRATSSTLRTLRDSLDRLCERTERVVKSDEAEYFKMFHPVVGQPFAVEQFQPMALHSDSKKLTPNFIRDAFRYNETHGDICLEKLIGTFPLQRSSYRCWIDADCHKMMASPSQTGYSLTHQLLYFILAETGGCDNIMDIVLSPATTKSHQRLLCGEILVENRKLLTNGRLLVKNQYIDLFIEQAMLCSMIGFSNFVDEVSLRAVLQHQDMCGCFKYPPPRRMTHHEPIKVKRLMRERRREKMDSELCLAHTSGLAAAYMALYVQHKVYQLY